jgi:putative membrane protein
MMWQCGFNNGGYHMGGAIFLMIFWVVVIGLIIWGAMRMSRHAHGCCGHGEHQGSDALQIAKERYAKGEINEKEFEQIKNNLS